MSGRPRPTMTLADSPIHKRLQRLEVVLVDGDLDGRDMRHELHARVTLQQPGPGRRFLPHEFGPPRPPRAIVTENRGNHDELVSPRDRREQPIAGRLRARTVESS